ncbi:Glycosyl transferase family 2 [Cruoricaptor ignavus]|uniref:Glycosyl transferase family 2 n=1 Tax=Cruoricaptor ignavus TaxID=1118202 RepID=A0A1M6BH76_9FLAO|nr:glycosyltransferase [Cruoricaptor ignavus]SHI48036.1 Glycosyl transferase family 2 [Cruoricaptor ignavus]
MVTLSIITPVYNTPSAYLQEYLNSISKAKINCSYEILLINDGSTSSDTTAFLSNIKEKHIKIISKENEGVSSARNLGITEAKGEYILFLDSDDVLLEPINNAIAFLEKNKDYDLVYSDTIYFGDQKFYYKKGHFSKFRLVYISNFLNISTLFTRKIAENFHFDENLSYAEDYDFWCKIALANFKFKYLPSPIFKYRRILNGQSLSQINENRKKKIASDIRKKYQNKYIPNIEDINEFIINNFKDDKKQLLKLLLIVLLPKFYKILVNKKDTFDSVIS